VCVKATMDSPYVTNGVMDSAVGLILVELGDRRNAMTVSFFSEVAHHPTALWVSVARTAYTHELIRAGGQFTVAVLNQTQAKLAYHCGTSSGRAADKCAALNLYKSPRGFLFMGDALASTACSLSNSIDIDDHTLFVADILESHLSSRQAHRRHLLLSDL
jgi:flavin reductase (DIM6/NTAB) family NADH-FMN oxidoreductase RutF